MKPTGLVHRDMHNQMIADRDAEIARLKAEVERLTKERNALDVHYISLVARRRAALAAGPAALRKMSKDYEDNVVANTLLVPDARERGLRRCSDLISDAQVVEAAQEAALKDDDHG